MQSNKQNTREYIALKTLYLRQSPKKHQQTPPCGCQLKFPILRYYHQFSVQLALQKVDINARLIIIIIILSSPLLLQNQGSLVDMPFLYRIFVYSFTWIYNTMGNIQWWSQELKFRPWQRTKVSGHSHRTVKGRRIDLSWCHKERIR